MSRIGRQPIPVPSGVKLRQDGQRLAIEGPKGGLAVTLPPALSLQVRDQKLQVERQGDSNTAKSLHGLYRALIANMVEGVANGFSKELEITGVGYRAQVQGKQVVLHVGLSHAPILPIPTGVTVEVPKPTTIIVRGADKQLVGQFAADIRRVAPPEPYKGKGIKYANEVIRRKAGKAATGAKAASN